MPHFEPMTPVLDVAAPAADHRPSTVDLLDLSSPRVVSFKDRGVVYTYTFSRIGAEAWDKYFSGLHVAAMNDGKGVRNVVDIDTSGSRLVRENVTSVSGYAGDFLARENWRDLLPAFHVKAVALMLQRIEVVIKDGAIDPLKVEVELAATWTSGGDGLMGRTDGLVHRFSPPNAEQERRYNRAASESRVVGGSRNGMTVYPARQKLMVTMYDELIQGVDGYSLAGKPLASLEEIRREMDAAHKVASVKELFRDPDDDTEAPEKP